MKNYSSGNYVIQHPNGQTLNYNFESMNDDAEEKEETFIALFGFSIIVASLFFGLYVVCCVYSIFFGMYLKFHSSLKELSYM